jgi:ATP-dependent Lhr-like helicase
MQTADQDSLVEILRSRLEALGPVTVEELTQSFGLASSRIESALLALENEGGIIRGQFTGGHEQEWCDRRLLARIHRYTLDRLRKEVAPVSPADFMRFLFSWQCLGTDAMEGSAAVRKVIDQLEGYEAPAAAWEGDLLPARIGDYDHAWLDELCNSGQLVWGRLHPQSNGKSPAGPIKTTPICFANRPNLSTWLGTARSEKIDNLRHPAREVLELLGSQGALFFDEVRVRTGLLEDHVEQGISELVARGLLTSDSFVGLRAFLVDSKFKSSRRRSRRELFTMQMAGRWSILPEPPEDRTSESLMDIARTLLRRYGVVFRKLSAHEGCAPWRDLVRVLRTMEARGETRGGRFVGGAWGEQFALPEAIPRLRKISREQGNTALVAISAADPLNLTGIITPGRRVPGIFSNRVLYRSGVPIAIKEGKAIRFLVELTQSEQWELQQKLVRREISTKIRPHLGRGVGWQ